MSSTLQLKVESLLEELCWSDESFTTVDVSNSLKEEGVNYGHREIARVVRKLYSDGFLEDLDYTKSLASVMVNGEYYTTSLYHHVDVEPGNQVLEINKVEAVPTPTLEDAVAEAKRSVPSLDDVISRLKKGKGKAKKKTRVINVPSQRVTIEEEEQVLNRTVRYEKADGRLEVPAQWVRELGWENQVISAIPHVEGIRLVLEETVSIDTELGLIKVNNDRLRVAKSILTAANLDRGNRGAHTVSLFENSIVVG